MDDRLSSAQHRMPAAGAGIFVGQGGGGPGGCATRGQTLMRGLGTAGPFFRRESPLSKIERGCWWQLLIGLSRMLSRVVAGLFPPPP
jgi:hypothetical protein